jgi:hypothetical protein
VRTDADVPVARLLSTGDATVRDSKTINDIESEKSMMIPLSKLCNYCSVSCVCLKECGESEVSSRLTKSNIQRSCLKNVGRNGTGDECNALPSSPERKQERAKFIGLRD